MSLDNYDLISILDKGKSNPKIFKVKHKASKEYYVWNIIDAQNLTNQQSVTIEDKFKLRKALEHPNLLDVLELIKDEETNLLYLVTEYCRHGSLKDLMDLAFRDNSRICEEFLCRIMYQIALVVKTVHSIINFDINHIFFDEDYGVKLLNFDFHHEINKLNHLFKPTKIRCLGIMLFEVCTLTKFKKSSFEKELKNYNNLYSKGFLSLINTMVRDTSDLKKNVDKILCNSSLLVKTTQWNRHKVLIKVDANVEVTEKNDVPYALYFEELRKKGVALQKKEKELNDREVKIRIKHKKLVLLEKRLSESLMRTEEFEKYNSLKCHCSKGTKPREDLNSTYASCGDSLIVPTSKKLNIKEIIKPPMFTRTVSERRIKFKGHSPLKDIDFNRRRSIKHPKAQKVEDVKHKSSDWISCSDDTDKSSLTYNATKTRQLFKIYQNKDSGILVNGDVGKQIPWSTDNKKHAFELLKLMTDDEENKPPDVKHTYL